MNDERTQKIAFNVVGTIIGALLAGLAIFGIVASQQTDSPQKYTETINYNS